ncbi:MAG: hypothetical protein HDQ88_04470 [Clostridia bacterium]|nr:hypothetical protein [Clostridia bacterium]
MTKKLLSLLLALCMAAVLVPSAFAAEGDAGSMEEGSVETLADATPPTYVARIGTTFYRTLATAVQCAEAHDVIEVLEPNVQLTDTAVIESDVTLDIPDGTSVWVMGDGRLTVIGQLNVLGDLCLTDNSFLDATYGMVIVGGNVLIAGQKNVYGTVTLVGNGRAVSNDNISGYLSGHVRSTDGSVLQYGGRTYAYAWVYRGVIDTDPPLMPADVKLGGLSVSAGSLSPSFATNTYEYDVTVENGTKSIWVLPSASQGLTIKVNGHVTASGVASDNIGLSVGTNKIYVDVTRDDGSVTVRYTLNVTRKDDVAKYNVRVENTTHGSFLVDPLAAVEGTQVTIQAKPDSGYEVTGVVAVSNGQTIDVVRTGTNTYAFRMPRGDVTVDGTFGKKPVRFDDVKAGQWFYDHVIYAADAGWIAGIGNNLFSPNTSMCRGDFCIMMARIDGANLSGYHASRFKDVPDDSYYMQAIAYCADKGYVSGIGNGKFAPKDTITREQMAQIISNVKKLDKNVTPVKKFNDDAKISSWARGAIYACLNAKILAGDNAGNVNPVQPATRAEAAAMLVRAFG